MQEPTKEIEDILYERFGHDTVISLATTKDGMPHVRYVNAFYYEGSFYVLTYALSNKIDHISANANVALAGDWFTAHGKGKNMGYFGKSENGFIAEKMKNIFSVWIDNGHNDFNDPNTVILRICLTDAVIFSHGVRYDVDFHL